MPFLAVGKVVESGRVVCISGGDGKYVAHDWPALSRAATTSAGSPPLRLW